MTPRLLNDGGAGSAGGAGGAGTALLPGPGEPGAPAPARGTGGQPVAWARVPRVNLLPLEIIDDRRFRAVRARLVGAVVGVLGCCALATGWAQYGVSDAQAGVDETRAQTTLLQQQQAKYAEVPKVSAQLEAARTAREKALGNDVLWYRFLTDLAVNTPDGATLKTVSIKVETPGSAGSASRSGSPGLGTVKITGDATRFIDVAAWLDASGKVNGMVDPLLQSASRSEDQSSGKVSFSGGATVSSAALSHRYDRKAS